MPPPPVFTSIYIVTRSHTYTSNLCSFFSLSSLLFSFLSWYKEVGLYTPVTFWLLSISTLFSSLKPACSSAWLMSRKKKPGHNYREGEQQTETWGPWLMYLVAVDRRTKRLGQRKRETEKTLSQFNVLLLLRVFFSFFFYLSLVSSLLCITLFTSPYLK